MENLVLDMARLRGEIETLRTSRRKMRKSLRGNVSEMMSDFANCRNEVAERGRACRLAFLGTVRETVAELKARTASFRGEFANVLSRSRDAWWLGSVPLSKTEDVKTRRAKSRH